VSAIFILHEPPLGLFPGARVVAQFFKVAAYLTSKEEGDKCETQAHKSAFSKIYGLMEKILTTQHMNANFPLGLFMVQDAAFR
jgi:hypothetical protein